MSERQQTGTPQNTKSPITQPLATNSAATKTKTWIPMTAADVSRRRNRKILQWSGAAVAAVLITWLLYRGSVRPQEAQQAYDAGLRLYNSANYQQSILNFDRAISLNSSYVEAYRIRARAYFSLRNVDAAIADFSKVSELAPNDASVCIERGFIYLNKKDYPRAIADANRAVTLNPKLARGYNLRGTAIRDMGDPQRAVPDFTRALDVDQNLENYFQRAATYQLLRQHDKAISDFNRALEISPEQPHTYFARARSRTEVGDEAGAREDYTRGRKLDGW
jgi:tetratricopeptide (TPR) repeat protein